MKNILLALLATVTIATAQTNWTYSTNLFYADPFPDWIYIGTNGTDPGGYDYHHWACVINHNAMLETTIQTQSSSNTAAFNLLSNGFSSFTNSFQTITNTAFTGIVTNSPFIFRFTNGLLMRTN